MKKLITILSIMLMSSTVLSANLESEKTPKKLYSYQALIALYFPNEAYNSISLDEQCKGLGGVLVSTANRKQAYSVDAYSGVCKIPITSEQ